MYFRCRLPGVADVGPRFAGRDVLGDEKPGIDALEILEDLRRVAGHHLPRFLGVRREETRDWSADGGAVEVVGGEVPFRKQDRNHRVAVQVRMVLDR